MAQNSITQLLVCRKFSLVPLPGGFTKEIYGQRSDKSSQFDHDRYLCLFKNASPFLCVSLEFPPTTTGLLFRFLLFKQRGRKRIQFAQGSCTHQLQAFLTGGICSRCLDDSPGRDQRWQLPCHLLQTPFPNPASLHLQQPAGKLPSLIPAWGVSQTAEKPCMQQPVAFTLPWAN